MKPIIYVAGAYTGNELANTKKAMAVGDVVIGLGGIPFVPHLFHFWHEHSPKEYGIWMEIDEHFLLVSNAVFKISNSHGANQEERVAKEKGIPVFYNENELRLFIERW
jgi:hypothetical protein